MACDADSQRKKLQRLVCQQGVGRMNPPPIVGSNGASAIGAASHTTEETGRAQTSSTSTQRPQNETALAHVRNGRDTALYKKLLANVSGEAAITIPMAAVNLLVNVISAAARKAPIGHEMEPAGIAAGTQSGLVFALGAVATTSFHYTGLDKFLHGTGGEEKERLQERAVLSGMMAMTAPILISLGFNLMGNASSGKKQVNHDSVVTAVAEELTSTLVATGVITAGVAAMCKYDPAFQQMIARTLTHLRDRATHAGQKGLALVLNKIGVGAVDTLARQAQSFAMRWKNDAGAQDSTASSAPADNMELEPPTPSSQEEGVLPARPEPVLRR
jgi:hypothetical protein